MSNKSNTPVADPKNKYLGAGAIYFNYGLAGEAVIGATKGGSKFNTNREFRTSEQDGIYGDIKGDKRKTKLIPQLTVNMLELKRENLAKFIAGGDLDTSGVDYDEFRERLEIQDTDYIDNVAFVGQNYAGEDIIIILENVLGDGSLELAMEHEEDVVPEIQLTAHYDPSTPTQVPYVIRYMKGTTYSVTFTVDDGTNPIENATVEFNGMTQQTDATGQTIFTGVNQGTNLPYTITAAGYNTIESSVNVSTDTTETVSMTLV